MNWCLDKESFMRINMRESTTFTKEITKLGQSDTLCYYRKYQEKNE